MGAIGLAFIVGVLVGVVGILITISALTRRLDRAMGHDDGTPPVLYPRPTLIRSK